MTPRNEHDLAQLNLPLSPGDDPIDLPGDSRRELTQALVELLLGAANATDRSREANHEFEADA